MESKIERRNILCRCGTICGVWELKDAPCQIVEQRLTNMNNVPFYFRPGSDRPAWYLKDRPWKRDYLLVHIGVRTDTANFIKVTHGSNCALPNVSELWNLAKVSRGGAIHN
jgi:hypothetical protein